MTIVVVTGLGVISAAGRGVDSLHAAMKANVSCIRPLSVLSPGNCGGHLAGEIPATVWAGPPQSRCMDITRLAAGEALESAMIDKRDRMHLGVFLGTAGEMRYFESELLAEFEGRVPVTEAILSAASWITSRLADHYGLSGAQFTYQNACSAGASAIAQAMAFIRAGAIDVALAGGSEVISNLNLSGFQAIRALSRRGCFPFDVDRDGVVLGEGAAFLVLESASRAKARGAVAIAEVRGAGFSCDAFHRTRPHPEGLGATLAIRRALADGGLAPDDIDYINAHGTGTKLNDAIELRAIRAAIGERCLSIPISSLKGLTGHCVSASGAIEAVACCLALRDGFLPASTGLRQEEREFEGWYLLRQPETGRVKYALSNSFAFGGNNVSLIFAQA